MCNSIAKYLMCIWRVKINKIVWLNVINKTRGLQDEGTFSKTVGREATLPASPAYYKNPWSLYSIRLM